MNFKKELEKELTVFINEKHTQEECTGFISGFEKAIELFSWIEFSKQEPEIGQAVDVYTKHNGRCCNYKYEGKGVFYNNDKDDTKGVNFFEKEHQYNVTHWVKIIENPLRFDFIK